MQEEEGMFCAGCGARFIADARFCEVCGLTKGVKDEDNTILTFDEYRDKKRKERSSRFVSKSVKKVKKENSENEVTIQIGLIRLKDGQLKAIRGSSLPLKVFPSIGAEELLRKGAEKMVKFNSDLSLYGASSFTLLYTDRTEVPSRGNGTVHTTTIQGGIRERLRPNYHISLQNNSYHGCFVFEIECFVF